MESGRRNQVKLFEARLYYIGPQSPSPKPPTTTSKGLRVGKQGTGTLSLGIFNHKRVDWKGLAWREPWTSRLQNLGCSTVELVHIAWVFVFLCNPAQHKGLLAASVIRWISNFRLNPQGKLPSNIAVKGIFVCIWRIEFTDMFAA